MINVAKEDRCHALGEQWSGVPAISAKPVNFGSIDMKYSSIISGDVNSIDVIYTSEACKWDEHHSADIEYNGHDSHYCDFLQQTDVLLKRKYQSQQQAT